MRTMSINHRGLIAACTLLVGCTNDSTLSSTGGGGAGSGGSSMSPGGSGGLTGHAGSAGGVTGSGGATRTTGTETGGGPGGGLSGSGGLTVTTGGIPGGSGGMAGGGGNSSGGLGGRNGGTGGATNCAIMCVVPRCQYGELPGPPPCGCPICAPPPDGSAGLDGATELDAGVADAPMVCNAACALPNCPNGTVKGPPPCNCPICAPSDAGPQGDDLALDGPLVCSGIACPMIVCLDGYLPSPTLCGCPICSPVDGGDGRIEGAACGAATDPPCSTGMHCEWSDKMCGSRIHGACTSFPGGAACGRSAAPVCGCDGKNYTSPCEAARNGVDISSNASCPEPAGMFRCGWSYCQHNVQYCHAQIGGAVTNPGSYACDPLPASCGGVSSCACVTGSATCDANANGDVTVTIAVP